MHRADAGALHSARALKAHRSLRYNRVMEAQSEGTTRQTVLSNNVVLLEQSVDHYKTAALSFYFAAGSRFEGEGQRGAAHFVEHMLFKGTKTRTLKQIATVFESMGGLFNAYTEKEVVCIYCSFPSQNASCFCQAVDILCDISEGCTFSDDEVERERGVIQSEILSGEDDPDECAMEEVCRAVWGEQDLALPVAGTCDDVASLSRKALLSWYERYIASGELVVAAAGKLWHDELAERLSKLSHRKRALRQFERAHFTQPVKWLQGSKVVSSKFEQVQLFCLYPMKDELSCEQFHTLEVFNSIAGEATTSRLFYSLREVSGLCYQTGSLWAMYEGAGFWAAYAVCEKDKADDVTFGIERELKRLASPDITGDEVDTAKKRLSGLEVMAECRPAYLTQRLWSNYSMGFALSTTDQVLDEIARVTRDDVAAFAVSLLDEAKRAQLIYGN